MVENIEMCNAHAKDGKKRYIRDGFGYRQMDTMRNKETARQVAAMR